MKSGERIGGWTRIGSSMKAETRQGEVGGKWMGSERGKSKSRRCMDGFESEKGRNKSRKCMDWIRSEGARNKSEKFADGVGSVEGKNKRRRFMDEI